jgi:predicted nucleotidyltransferase
MSVMMNHPVVEKLREAGISFHLFGSHLTGLATVTSNIDLLVSCTPDEFGALETKLRSLGFLDALKKARREFEQRVRTSSGGTPNRPDTNLFGIFKWTDIDDEMLPSVDVIVAEPAEAKRRLVTLNAIRMALAFANEPTSEDIKAFVKTLKSNHPHWRALHLITDAAVCHGRFAEAQGLD